MCATVIEGIMGKTQVKLFQISMRDGKIAFKDLYF